MGCNTSELSSKEVINVCDCRRLGYVCDYEINPCDGRITAIFVPSCTGIFGINKGAPIRIDWCDIQKIGDEIILVSIPEDRICRCPPQDNEKPPKKKGFFF